MRDFDAKLFVESAWEHVYENLIESGNSNEAKELGDIDLPLETDCQPSAEPVQRKSDSTNLPQAEVSSSKEVPKDSKGSMDALLPTGKDPESRKLRRLMRNRLSAQASRDRRKKAIEDVKKMKAEKKAEIANLEKTMTEEKHRLKLLEKAIGCAREHLGHVQFERLSAAHGPSIRD